MRLLLLFIFLLALKVGAQPVSTTFVQHTVDKGDTWYSISKKYGIEITTIQKHNNLQENNFDLSEGSVLEIPMKIQITEEKAEPKKIRIVETEHKVKKGETLYSIAKLYEMNLRELQKMNRITYASPPIKPGMKLKVNSKAAALASEPPAEKTERAKSIKTSDELKVKETPKKDKDAVQAPLEVNINPAELKLAGKTIHTVKKGETLYSIAKKYSMSIRELRKSNKVSGNDLPLGKQLIVNDLVSASEVVYGPEEKKVSENEAFVVASEENDEKMEDAETVFFEVKEEPDVDKQKSQRPTNVDTSLNNIRAIPEKMNKSDLENQEQSDLRRRFENYSRSGVVTNLEKGVAIWHDDMYGYGQDHYFALHHSASMGNVLKVKNLLNGRTVFVKVIGRLPQVDLINNTIMKISYTAADDLNFIDDKVQVEVTLPVKN